MKTFSNFCLSLFFSCLLVLQSCSPDGNVQPRNSGEPSFGADIYGVTEGEHPKLGDICAAPQPHQFKDANGNAAIADFPDAFGEIKISNSSSQVFIQIELGRDWFLVNTNIYAGDLANAPLTQSNSLDVGSFPWQSTMSPVVNSATVAIPLTELSSDCNDWIIQAEISRLASFFGGMDPETLTPVWAGSSTFINGRSLNYCQATCPDPYPTTISPGDFQTGKVCDWGGCNVKGTFVNSLDANFSANFPNGVTLGCDEGFTLSLTSSNAVKLFLPSRGKERALDQNITDPIDGSLQADACRSKSDDDDLLCACDSRRSKITFKLNNDFGSPSTINVLDDKMDLLASFANVQPGEQRTLDAANLSSGSGSKLPKELYFRVLAGNQPDALVETECKFAIIGDHGNFSIVSWEDKDGVFCNSPSPQFRPSNSGGCPQTPGVEYRNSLAAQILAATLNVTWDLADPDFSASSLHLADLEIASGDFAGLRVADLIALGNKVLGGCNTEASEKDIAEALASINTNFDRSTNDGFLIIPGNASLPDPNCECEGGMVEIQFALREDYGTATDINVYRTGGVLITTYNNVRPSERLTLTSPRSKLDSDLEIEVVGSSEPSVNIATDCKADILGSKGDLLIIQHTDTKGNTCSN